MHAHLLDPTQPQSSRVAVDDAASSILIVDDDQEMVEALSMRLKQQGFTVHAAHTGNDGLVKAHAEHPDLVLLDLRMPGPDGFTICQELADAPDTAAIPVIILSGMERPDIIRRSRAAGCQYFVRKPYDPNALLILIRHAIEEARHWGT